MNKIPELRGIRKNKQLEKFTKLTKRKDHKDLTHLQQYKNDISYQSKDIKQILREKMFNDHNSEFYKGDVAYYVAIIKKGKSLNLNITNNLSNSSIMSGSNNDTTQNNSGLSKFERYFAIVQKANTEIFLLLVNIREGELDTKGCYNMKLLKSIDLGIEDNELMLSTEHNDVSVFFRDQTDRDESLWVTIQICKSLSGSAVSVGYSVDIEALTYMTTTAGTLNRFPRLQKVINITGTQYGNDLFHDEEAEAEQFIIDMNWDIFSGTHSDIQQKLSQQSEKLNTEIIDYLLQWEEMDGDTLNNQQKKGVPVSHNGPSATDKMMSLSNMIHHTMAKGNPTKSNSKGIEMDSKIFANVRDTRDILIALKLVDKDLGIVDEWLGDQINRLNQIQKNLHMIEDESGELETNWKNLNSVHELIEKIVQGYTISTQFEEILRKPSKILDPILKSNSLNLVSSQLIPLEDAMTSLKNALNLKYDNIVGTGTEASNIINLNQWKQLQRIVAISSQKAYLNELADEFSNQFVEFGLNLFDWLLKHKALVDGIGRGEPNITIKQFTFNFITDKSIVSNRSNHNLNHDSSETTPESMMYSKPLTVKNVRMLNNNPFLISQSLYHNAIHKFLPVLNLFYDLSPSLMRPIHESYLRTTHERFYAPIIKTLCRDLQSNMNGKNPVVNLSNCSRYKLHVKNDLPLRYNAIFCNNSNSQLNAWTALKALLIIITPVLEHEEIFLSSKLLKEFNLDKSSSFYESKDAASGNQKTRLSQSLETLFSTLMPRLESSIFMSGSSNNEVDGMEAIAMLTQLYYFEGLYNEALSNRFASGVPMTREYSGVSVETFSTKSGKSETLSSPVLFNMDSIDSRAIDIIPPSVVYINKFFVGLRSLLVNKINTFTLDQTNWIAAQKGDPKSPGVAVAFIKFPSFVQQVLEMTNGLHFECVDQLLYKLVKELLNWLTTFARQSEKYTDKVRVINFEYFIQSMSPMNLPLLENFLTYAGQQNKEAMIKYVNWMVSHEFPELSALAARMDGVGGRVQDDELSLYIRRKDVLNVVKELDIKTIETSIGNIFKRLEKHFKSDYDTELHLISTTWKRIEERVVSIVQRLEAAASVSYQINLEVGPRVVGDLFQKYSTNL